MGRTLKDKRIKVALFYLSPGILFITSDGGMEGGPRECPSFQGRGETPPSSTAHRVTGSDAGRSEESMLGLQQGQDTDVP